MESSTKKRVTGALVAPVLSLTILCAGNDAAIAENHTLLEKIFSPNKTKSAPTEQMTLEPRLIQLEQAVRDLTMQLEAQQFTLMQMQNRLDVLEGRDPSYPHIATGVAELAATKANTPPLETIPAIEPAIETARNSGANDVHIFGSVRFDGSAHLEEANLPEILDPQELYKTGYQYIMAGDYPAAERIFRHFQERFPDDEQIADASFWLGEALYAQGQYRAAAQIYIDVQRQHQHSAHGPENLLKLGLSMAQLQETQVACKTLTEVPKRYTQAEPALLKRVHDEKNRLDCP